MRHICGALLVAMVACKGSEAGPADRVAELETRVAGLEGALEASEKRLARLVRDTRMQLHEAGILVDEQTAANWWCIGGTGGCWRAREDCEANPTSRKLGKPSGHCLPRRVAYCADARNTVCTGRPLTPCPSTANAEKLSFGVYDRPCLGIE